ncbi:hypothetical protein NOK12_19580 [Nocardioides sp. OK12]|nr:hypothetical protein NOK12_19580 [Nocardioides sp. OK12]
MGVMSDAAPARPRQVTVAAWLIILGSVFVVLSAFGQVSGVSSLETRERIEALLSEPPADGLGLSVGTVLDMLRVVAMVAAATATATAILGTQVLQRSRAARTWLSVLAVPLFLSAAFIGGFMGALVAAAVVMLWLQPAKSWFAGEPLPERFNADGTLRKDESAQKPAQKPAPAPERDHQPVGHGAPPQQPSAYPPPPAYPQQQPGPAPYAGFGHPQAERPQAVPGGAPAPGPRRRPAALAWACALTWVGSGLVSLFWLLATLVFVAVPQADFDELLEGQPEAQAQLAAYDWAEVTQSVYVMTAVSVTWSIVAIVLAVLAFRGVAWARLALTVSSAALAGVLFVWGVVWAPAMLLVMVPVAATVVLLLRPDVRAWRR